MTANWKKKALRLILGEYTILVDCILQSQSITVKLLIYQGIITLPLAKINRNLSWVKIGRIQCL